VIINTNIWIPQLIGRNILNSHFLNGIRAHYCHFFFNILCKALLMASSSSSTTSYLSTTTKNSQSNSSSTVSDPITIYHTIHTKFNRDNFLSIWSILILRSNWRLILVWNYKKIECTSDLETMGKTQQNLLKLKKRKKKRHIVTKTIRRKNWGRTPNVIEH